MERIRSFVAIELAPEMETALERVQRRLKVHVTLPVRWVEPRGTHLTLKFLGDIDVTRVEAVKQALERAVAGARPFSISLGRVGGFPSLSRPRVLWVGVEGDLAPLTAVQGRIEGEMAALGFAREDRAFHPHLTLGRVRDEGRRGPPLDADAIERGMDVPGATQEVESVTLFRSDLRPSGAVYTRLASFTLRRED